MVSAWCQLGADLQAIPPWALNWRTWRGGPQHQISRILKACDIIPGDEPTGRAAGTACAASGTADVVDVLVIATAVRSQAPVVTSDPMTSPTSPTPSE